MQSYYTTTTEGPVFPGTVIRAIPLAGSGFYIAHILADSSSQPLRQSSAFLDSQIYSVYIPPNLILCLPYLVLPDCNPAPPLDEHGPGLYTTEPFSEPSMSSFQPFTALKLTVPFTSSIQMPTLQAGEFTNGVLAEPYLSQSSNLNISPGGYYPTFHPVDQALEDQAFTLSLDPLPVHSTQDTFILPEQLSSSLALDPNLVMDDFSQRPFLAPPILTGSSPVSRQTQPCSTSC